MRKYVDQLKPKANKLLAFVTNWQLAKPDKNVELSRSLNELMNKGTFPSPIRSFFKLPQFKSLLSTMEVEGKLFIMPQLAVNMPKDVLKYDSHPPIEIQNIQIMVEALHKLVHLDYNKQLIREPSVQAKIYGDNILEYLGTVSMFFPFESKTVDDILEYLFKALRKYSIKLKELISKNETSFSPLLCKLMETPIFDTLLHIDRKSYRNYMIEDWHPILVELNIDAKLSRLTKQLRDISSANAHKLLNQMKTLLDDKRQFYQRNTPRYVPKRLKEVILEKLNESSDGKPIFGQKVNELFYDEFLHQRYEVVEARQLGINNKFQAYAEQFLPIKKSMISLIDQYYPHLPDQFCHYFNEKLKPLSNLLSILGKPNHLAVQLISGFYTSQLDYISDMLTSNNHISIDCNFEDDITNILPIIHSFFDSYYVHCPKPSYKTIRSLLENIFVGEEALKSYSIEEVKQKINSTFLHLLPLEERSFISLEASLNKIVKVVSEISKKLPKDSMEKQLLDSVLDQLLNLDLPSYSQTWYIFGSLLSVFFILLSTNDILFNNTRKSWLSRLKESTFFQVMFFQS